MRAAGEKRDYPALKEPPTPSDDFELNFGSTARPMFQACGARLGRNAGGVATMFLSSPLKASPVSEELRLLRARINALDEERPLRCFGVVSAAGNEGKSTVSLGLASALASEPGRGVLLVEADLRKPMLEKYLDLAPATGLAEWLDAAQRPVGVRRIAPAGFDLLSAGSIARANPALLDSPQMAELMREARHTYDTVVVDCPPLVPVADTVFLQDLLDGFLFVVRARHSPRETLEDAVSRLKPGCVRGVVYNDHHELLTSYRSYAYRRYGEYR